MKCSCGFEDEHWDVIDIVHDDVYETYVGYKSIERKCALKISGHVMRLEACPNCGGLRIIKPN